jgi:hypothetical protein
VTVGKTTATQSAALEWLEALRKPYMNNSCPNDETEYMEVLKTSAFGV